MKSGTPNQVQGALDYLRVNDSGNNRALVRFYEAAIASAVGTGILTAAFLELDIVDNVTNWSADGRAVDVHRGTNAAWTESGATWACALDSSPSDGSANCSGGNAWVMGASGPNPWVATPTDTQLIANDQTGVSWDVTADVVAFLSGTTNAGWIVKKADEGVNGRADFAARPPLPPGEGGGEGPHLVLIVAAAGEDAGTPGGGPGNTIAANQDSYIRQGARNANQGASTMVAIARSCRFRNPTLRPS